MTTIADRIKALYEAWCKANPNKSLFDLSIATRVPQPTLQSWINGTRTPSDLEMLGRLADEFQTTSDWIGRGKGKPGPLIQTPAKKRVSKNA